MTMERGEATGISILVVGGGIAGLSFAIEAFRKGHDVRVIERRGQGEYFGKKAPSPVPSFPPAYLPPFIANHWATMPFQAR